MLIVPLLALNGIEEIGGSLLASFCAGVALFVLTTWTGRRRDTTVEEKKKTLDDSAKIDKVYTLLQGDEWNDGLVKVVRSLQSDMATVKFQLTTNGFKQPGGKDTVLDNLQQIRHNTTPDGGETRPHKPEEGPL